MILVNPTLSTQTLKFIPREYSADEIKILDEQENIETSLSVSGFQSSYYFNVDITYTFKEGRFYRLRVFNAGEIVYQDKIFATEQGVNYSINKDEYLKRETENDFITLD